VRCPKCKVSGSEVLETRAIKQDTWAKRRHWCVNDACGLRWTTYEKNAPDPQFAIHKRESTPGNSAQPTTVIGQAPPQELRETGESGSVSDPDPISFRSSQLPDPDRSKQTKLQVDRARGAARKKGEPFKFTPEFLTFWFAIESNRAKGSKAEAFLRWTEEKAPGAAPMIAKWREFMVSLGDTFAPDVCRWIARRGWEQEYERAPTPLRSRQNGIDRKTEEHRQMFEEGRAWARGDAK